MHLLLFYYQTCKLFNLLHRLIVLTIDWIFWNPNNQWLLKCRTESAGLISTSIIPYKWQHFPMFHLKMQNAFNSMYEVTLKLVNCDKQVTSFEETFVGSTIILIIIVGILLTVLLWLRRLWYYSLPYGIQQNYVKVSLVLIFSKNVTIEIWNFHCWKDSN